MHRLGVIAIALLGFGCGAIGVLVQPLWLVIVGAALDGIAVGVISLALNGWGKAAS